MPTNPETAPISTESHNILLNESVSMRALAAGITRAAAISRTPMTFIVATARDAVDHDGRQESPRARTEIEVDLQNETDDGSAEDRVRHAVTDVTHPPEDDVDADEPTERAGEHANEEPVDEEVVMEGLKQGV